MLTFYTHLLQKQKLLSMISVPNRGISRKRLEGVSGVLISVTATIDS